MFSVKNISKKVVCIIFFDLLYSKKRKYKNQSSIWSCKFSRISFIHPEQIFHHEKFLFGDSERFFILTEKKTMILLHFWNRHHQRIEKFTFSNYFLHNDLKVYPMERKLMEDKKSAIDLKSSKYAVSDIYIFKSRLDSIFYVIHVRPMCTWYMCLVELGFINKIYFRNKPIVYFIIINPNTRFI